MAEQFRQIAWDEQLREDWLEILQPAIREDLGHCGDWTSRALVSENAVGRAAMVAREAGVVAGLPLVETTLEAIEPRLEWFPQADDGRDVLPGDCIGRIAGPARGLLAAERLVLNLLGRLSGIATLTRRYVEAVAGTKARIYDTRKTTPGWRRLEKYAVRCGGGLNHRTGLFDAVLIKDNHLALGRAAAPLAPSSAVPASFTPAEAVARTRRFLQEHRSEAGGELVVEVEVDTLEQLAGVLPSRPDLVLLDNMGPAELREAVARRDAVGAPVELEASGGVSLDTVAGIAASGVDRISVGALTHSAASLDLGLDWLADDVA